MSINSEAVVGNVEGRVIEVVPTSDAPLYFTDQRWKLREGIWIPDALRIRQTADRIRPSILTKNPISEGWDG